MILLAGCATSMKDPKIDALMREYAGDGPGASVLVIRDGNVVARRSYGLADIEERIPASSATHYRLASLTKQFTAAAILTLSEDGSLALDDPVRRFLPSLPESANAVTIRHLLTHTSGLVDYEDVIPPDTIEQLEDHDVLRLLESQASLYFLPGSSYRYSNSGYALMALIVEKASGQSFADFTRARLFLPAGMHTTVAHEEGVSRIPDRAFGYSRSSEGWQRTDQSTTSAVLGDGGIYTSVDELAAWLRALDAGRFAEATVARVQTDTEGMSYGYGWRIHEHRGRRVFSHTGETRGFRNALVRFPDDQLAVVILTNRNEGKPLQSALAIADVYLAKGND